jgi:hypothetical protein
MMSTPDYDTRDQEGYAHSVENLQEEGAQRGRITNTDEALKFIMAGNAYFTLRSVRTSTRYTYRMAMPKKAREDAKLGSRPWYYVSLLNGPDNTHNYTWMGTILANGNFKQAPQRFVGMDAPSMRAFLWFYRYLNESSNRSQLPMDVEFWHEGRCGRCGRLLTVPESIARGIGPECAGRL